MTTSYDDVEIATPADIQEGIRRALDRIRLTYEELERQAKADKFDSEEARLVWFAISPPDGAVC